MRDNSRYSPSIIRAMSCQRLRHISLIAQAMLLTLAVPVSSVAQSSFDGTWKVDFQSAMPTKIDVEYYLVVARK